MDGPICMTRVHSSLVTRYGANNNESFCSLLPRLMYISMLLALLQAIDTGHNGDVSVEADVVYYSIHRCF